MSTESPNYYHPSQEIPLAYDPSHDENRLEELTTLTGNKETALQLLREEMAADLLSHFAELKGINLHSFKYLINSEGILVRDSESQEPIINIFQDPKVKNKAESIFWREQMIPLLEQCSPGSYVFNISAKNPDSNFEDQYDFAYVFYKTSKDEILAFGLQVDLSPEQQSTIINTQLLSQDNPQSLLPENPNWEQVRQTLVYFKPNRFESPTQAYYQILGSAIEKDLSQLQEIFDQDQAWFAKNQEFAQKHASTIITMLKAGYKLSEIQDYISQLQRQHITINHNTKTTTINGQDYLVLACGLVSMGDSLISQTMGNNIFTANRWEWKNGNCRCCGSQGVDVGPCNVCRICQAKFDRGETVSII